eukprot:gene8380-205_t
MNEDEIEQLKSQVKNSFIIERAVDVCPVLNDIYFLCLNYTPKENRKVGCEIHQKKLKTCLDYELNEQVRNNLKFCKNEVENYKKNKSEVNFSNISECMRNVFKNHYDPL